jgi:hypothetical protein
MADTLKVVWVNLTPHHINMPNGRVIAPVGHAARCTEESYPVGVVDGCEIIVRRYGEVHNIPEPKPGTYYIVSHMARVACPDRADLVSPGDLTRDEAGRVVGCSNFVVNSWMGDNA